MIYAFKFHKKDYSKVEEKVIENFSLRPDLYWLTRGVTLKNRNLSLIGFISEVSEYETIRNTRKIILSLRKEGIDVGLCSLETERNTKGRRKKNKDKDSIKNLLLYEDENSKGVLRKNYINNTDLQQKINENLLKEGGYSHFHFCRVSCQGFGTPVKLTNEKGIYKCQSCGATLIQIPKESSYLSSEERKVLKKRREKREIIPLEGRQLTF